MAVKTVKKRSVKAPKSKSVPKPRDKRVAGGMSDEIDKAVLQMTVSIAETNARLDACIAETNARIAESNARYDASIAESNASIKESIRAIREMTQDLVESVKNIGGNVGDVNNRLGEIVEMVMLSGLMDKMNAMYGYNFNNVSSDRIFKDNGQQYAEIDLFLENGEAVMAVEAKARVKEGDVNKLVLKLRKLREREVKAGLVGRTIYGAMAGIVFDDRARTAAKECGLYLVCIENNDKINIELPASAAGKW